MAGPKLHLLGGWGYGNLGDEAILRGYLEALGSTHDLTIVSAGPAQTRAAHPEGSLPDVVDEHELATRPKARHALVCGGGYLNGWWFKEATRKMARLCAIAPGNGRRTMHAVELRRLDRPWQRLLGTRLARSAGASVRDVDSSAVAARWGVELPVVPDAIALLWPAIGSFSADDRAAGRILVQPSDLVRRADWRDAPFDTRRWPIEVDRVFSTLGSTALAFATTPEEAEHLRSVHAVDVVEATTVAELVGLLRGADGVIATRMHVSLIASMVGTPVVAVPYNGKVAPTLRAVGVEHLVASATDADALVDAATRHHDDAAAWAAAHEATSVALRAGLVAIGR